MVRESRLKRSDFEKCEGDSVKRDELLKSSYNISDDELRHIRGGQSQGERLLRAAETLYKHTNDSAQITVDNLAALIADEWESRQKHVVLVSSTLHYVYKSERARKEHDTTLRLNNIQLLREDVGAYSGNLYEARKVWKNFQPSAADWLRSIRIPVEIGFDESQLLGVFWADGNLRIKGNENYLSISGSKDDFEFYEWVAERLEKTHNVQGVVYEIDRAEDNFYGKAIDYRLPAIIIGSSAIINWLKDDLGFPHPKKSVTLPKLEWTEEQKRGFLSGIVAGMGRMWRNFNIALHDKDADFISNLDCLFKSAQIPESFREPLYLIITPRGCKKLYSDGLLLHPEHIRKFDGRYGIHFRDVEDYKKSYQEGRLIDKEFMRRKRKKRKEFNRKLTDDQALELGIDYINGVDISAIGKKYDIRSACVFEYVKRLRKQGIITKQDRKRRLNITQKFHDEDKRLDIVADYLDGMSQEEVEGKYGINFTTIYRYFDEFKEIGLVTDKDMLRRKEKVRKKREFPIDYWRRKISEFHEYLRQKPGVTKKDAYRDGHQYALQSLYGDKINDARVEIGLLDEMPRSLKKPRERGKDMQETVRNTRLNMYLENNPGASYEDVERIGLADAYSNAFSIRDLVSVLSKWQQKLKI